MNLLFELYIYRKAINVEATIQPIIVYFCISVKIINESSLKYDIRRNVLYVSK